MRKTFTVGAVLAGVLSMACITAPPASSSDRVKRGKVEVIRADTQQVIPFTFQDHDGSGSPTAGDAVILSADYSTDGTKIGFDAGVCTIIIYPTRWLCHGTVSLARGTVTTQGIFDASNNPGPHHIAITGGTGAYRRARGQVTNFVSPDTRSGRTVMRIILR